MSALHSIKKNIESSSLRFDPSMYGNTVGSLVICAAMLTPDSDNVVSIDIPSINRKWQKVKKDPDKYIKCWIDNPNFISEWLSIFDIKVPDVFPIAAAISKWNILFVPYIDGQPYPIREDGIMPVTLTRAKIYPIKIGEPLK